MDRRPPPGRLARAPVLLALVGLPFLVPGLARAHPRARKADVVEIVGETIRYSVERRNRDVRAAVEDPSGVVWALEGAGTFLARAPGEEAEWREYPAGEAGPPPANYTDLELFGGGLWASTSFSGLAVHAAGTWVRRTRDHGLSSLMVKDMTVHRGYLWVANHGGLDRFSPGDPRAEAVPLPGEVEGSPTAVAGLGGGLAVGTSRGEVALLERGEWRVLASGGDLGGRMVRRMLAVGPTLWVGSFGGLHRIDPRAGDAGGPRSLAQEDPELAGVVVTDLAVREGELWVATKGAGLLRRTEPEEGAVAWAQYVPPYQALPSDTVHGVTVTPAGDVLAATDRGLARLVFMIDPRARVDVAVRIPRTDVPEETDLSRPDPNPRQILHTEALGSQMSPLSALGDILFEDPTILGEKAQRMGISCGSCHPSGHVNTNLFVEGISKVRAGIDLSNKHFSAAGENGIFDPVDTPSLRGVRMTGPYGRQHQEAGIREFIRRVIVLEFDGPEPSPRTLDALTAYVREFDFLPTRWVRDDGSLDPSAPDRVRRGEALFRKEFPTLPGGSCAACHRPEAFFTDRALHDVGTGGAFDTPTLRNANYSPPYMHDGRLRSYREVLEHFDRTFSLGLSSEERRDLEAYLEAVGEGIRPYE